MSAESALQPVDEIGNQNGHEARIKRLFAEYDLTDKQLAQCAKVMADLVVQAQKDVIGIVGPLGSRLHYLAEEQYAKHNPLPPPPPEPENQTIKWSEVQWFPDNSPIAGQARREIAQANYKCYYSENGKIFGALLGRQIDCHFVDDREEAGHA